MNTQKKETYNELKEENKQMKEIIKKLKELLKKQNIKFNESNNNNIQSSGEYHFMRNEIIVNKDKEEDKIEKQIKTLKSIIQKTKEKWNKFLKDISDLEEEIKNIKTEMEKDFEKMKEDYRENLKKNLQEQYDEKIKNINDCFDKKLKERFKNMEAQCKKQFDKLYNSNIVKKVNNVNEFEIQEGYSYKCLNKDKLYTIINQGDNTAKIKIILKNNGSLPWTESDTVLCFSRFKNKYSGTEKVLNPQMPGEENSYDITLNSLKDAKPGEYPLTLELIIGQETIGEEIKAKIIIKEKKD